MKLSFKRTMAFVLAMALLLCGMPSVFALKVDAETLSINAVREPSWACSELTYRVMDNASGYPNTMVFNKGQYWVTEFTWFEIADGRIGYCVQPYKSGATGAYVQNPAGWGSLSQQRQQGIGLAFLYGAPNNGKRSQADYVATAAVVRDMACGYRMPSTEFTYNGSFGDPNTYSPFGNKLRDEYPEAYAIYNQILADIAKHGTIPSFASKSKYGLTANQTITLKLNKTSGLWEGAATDTNGVLQHYDYVSTISGLTFTKSGNTLYVKATAAAAQQLTNGFTASGMGFEFEDPKDVCTIWTTNPNEADGGATQLISVMNAATDPVPSYFNVVAEDVEVDVNVVKTSEDGKVDGISFTVKNNTTNTSATYKTANGGKFSFKAQIGDSLTITETVPSGYSNAKNSQTITVASSGNTVTFNNSLLKGAVEVTKIAENGVAAGHQFKLSGTSTTGSLVSLTATTGSNGKATFSNVPIGTYTLEEINVPNYYIAPASQTVTVTVNGTTSVTTKATFTNLLKRGSLEVTKTSEDGLVEGIQFRLSGTSDAGTSVDLTATTGSNGKATFSDVPIGTYTLEEVDTAAKYVVPVSQNVTIRHNTTAQASVSNVLKKWTATVTKADADNTTAQGDATLAGAVYGVYNNGELVDQYTTDSNGQFTTKEYICGDNWTIREISPSDGYLLNETEYPVGAEAGNFTVEHNTISVGVTEKVILGNVSITKIAGGNGATKIEMPESGAEFQIYLKSAGSYENAADHERDVIVCDDAGQGTSKDLPYGTYVVHQSKGWEETYFHEDFEVIINEDGKTYPFIINNAWKLARIKVIKLDSTTNEVIPVAGVGFQFFDQDGTKITWESVYPTPATVDTYYTDSEGTLVTPFELRYGDYTAVEVAAPNGYVLNSDPIAFTVSENTIISDAGVDYVLMEVPNEPQMGVIKIEKKGEQFASVEEADGIYKLTFEEVGLTGAVYEITAAEDIVTPDGTVRYAAGTVVDTITTDAGIAESKELFLGKYSVKETAAPCGYVLDETSYGIELTYAGESVAITSTTHAATNDRQNAEISLTKQLEEDAIFGIVAEEKLPNVQFGLFAAADIAAADGTILPADGKVAGVNCAADGSLVFAVDLPLGSYYVQEIATDEHYIISDTKYPLEFADDTSTAVAQIVINDGEPITNDMIRGTIIGKKVDEDGFEIAGAKFGLFHPTATEYTEATAISVSTSNEIGVFGWEDVPFGSYIVRELKPALGFILNKTPYEVTISDDEEVVEIVVENAFLSGSVATTKVDSEYPENKLTGAAFAVYVDTDGNKEFDAGVDLFVGNLEEVGTGFYTLTGLRYNGYFLHETAAPAGFLPDENYYYFEIREDGEIITIENKAGVGFINEPKYGELELTKTDVSNGDLLPNAGFRIRNEAGEIVAEGFTDEKGVALFSLRVGKYTYEEFDAPDGYLLDTKQYPFEIKESGEIVKAVMTNSPVPDTPVTGDFSKVPMWSLLLAISAAAIAALLWHKKRNFVD